MVNKRYALSSHFVWLEDYVGQFKSHKPWHFMGCYRNLTSGCVMIWSFFKIGHRKGAMCYGLTTNKWRITRQDKLY
jgi:hypothetical protein